MNATLYKRYDTMGRKAVAKAEADVWADFSGPLSDVSRIARDNALDRASHAGDVWYAKRDAVSHTIPSTPTPTH